MLACCPKLRSSSEKLMWCLTCNANRLFLLFTLIFPHWLVLLPAWLHQFSGQCFNWYKAVRRLLCSHQHLICHWHLEGIQNRWCSPSLPFNSGLLSVLWKATVSSVQYSQQSQVGDDTSKSLMHNDLLIYSGAGQFIENLGFLSFNFFFFNFNWLSLNPISSPPFLDLFTHRP